MLTINCGTFQAWLASLLPAVSANKNIEVMTYLCFRKGQGYSHDGQCQIKRRLPKTAEGEFEGAVNANLLYKLVRSGKPNSELTLDIKGTNCVLRCGSLKATLPLLPADSFPIFSFDKKRGMTAFSFLKTKKDRKVNAGSFYDALKLCSTLVRTDSHRPMTQGVSMQVVKGEGNTRVLRCYSSDEHAVACAVIKNVAVDGFDQWINVPLVFCEALAAVAAVFDGVEPNFAVTFRQEGYSDHGRIRATFFENDEVQAMIDCMLLEVEGDDLFAEFYKTSKPTPEQFGKQFKLAATKDEMLAVLQRAAYVLTNEAVKTVSVTSGGADPKHAQLQFVAKGSIGNLRENVDLGAYEVPDFSFHLELSGFQRALEHATGIVFRDDRIVFTCGAGQYFFIDAMSDEELARLNA